MAVPLYTPRVNNNDDTVRLVHLFVSPGAAVRQGDPVADIETDKATFTVEAEADGFVLAYNAAKGDTIDVGSVLAWIGKSADEEVPAGTGSAPSAELNSSGVREPSLKAALLLAQYKIDPSRIPGDSSRISAEEVLRYIRQNGTPATTAVTPPTATQPVAAGQRVQLSPEEKGMLRTVEWQRREAVAAYAEIAYEDSAWKARAARFRTENGLLMDPMLAQFAWQLVQIARAQPQLNCTIVDGEKYVYDHVNLGFTVQSGHSLYVAVVRSAEALTEMEFVSRLSQLQRAAMKRSLKSEESSGATIGFTSMARWSVTRHMPILMPQTAIIVAHSASQNGVACLGATYDHRLLTGGDVAIGLNQLANAGSPE